MTHEQRPSIAQRRQRTALAGRDSFHVLDREGAERAEPKGAAAHALLVAHRTAETASDELTLIVERRSVLGPKVTIYKVTRDEHGTIYTNTINAED